MGRVARRGHENPTFLIDIHRLRGMAILLIVGTHCLYYFQWVEHPLILALLTDLFDDSVVIFIFISGHLFLHGSTSFSYWKYLRTKLKNVALPYVFVSLPAVIFALRHPDNVFNTQTLQSLPLAAKILYLYVYPGSHMNYALWFIPVIVLYYFAAPLLLWIARQPRWPALIPAAVLLSTFTHRPSYAHGHNLALGLYFLSPYLLGMFFCQHRERTLARIDRWLGWLLGAFLGFFIIHLLVSDHHGKYTFVHWFEFQDDGPIDWTYLQKLLLTVVLLGVAWRLRARRLFVLDYLADVSFAIYFLHLYVIFMIRWHTNWIGFDAALWSYIEVYSAAIVVPCLVATLLRILLPRWSRSLVGS